MTTLRSLLLLCLAQTALAAPDFARDVRPIFERSCFGCHGPEKQKNGYRLDVREIAIKGGESGERAIVPHAAKDSPLIRYVSGEEEDMLMPPKKSDKPRLTPEEIATLRAWIDAGPAWPDEFAGVADAKPHWSLAPLVQPPVPGTEPNPIDAFIRAKLAHKHIAPSPEADPSTLIRRISYDLTGLPPTPEEVEAFVREYHSPFTDHDSLVAAVADRLLTSPRHGERWARHWLDTIHFADSHGYEHDVARDNAWRFRDYVIAAFNRDTPWPRFIREQLAADFFFPEEPRLTPALGFLGAGLLDLSAFGTAPVTFDYIDRDDLVTQTMAAFVSTTANCARCHAHKFDPITQGDYYALQAVFAGVLKGDVAYDEDAAVMRERRRWQALRTAAEKQDAAVLLAAENAPFVEAWLAQPRAKWEPLAVETFLSAEGATLTRGADGVIVASGTNPDKDTTTITATTALPAISAVRLDVHAHDSLPMRGPGRCSNGNLHLSEFALRVFEPDGGQPREVKFRRATADFDQADWGIERALDGDIKTAWGIHPAVGQSHHAVFELAEKLPLKPGTRLAFVLKQAHGGSHLLGAFSLSATADENAAALPDAVAAALAATEHTPDQQLALAAHALRAVADAKLAALPTQARVFAAAPAVDIPGDDPAKPAKPLTEPKVVHVLHRGDFDKPREVAEPGALSALTHLPARFALQNPKAEAGRRAALADWLAHPDNVLTWRSVVNRMWHYHFARGLCDTPSDFGKMGGTPSHPELLDWLAVWFRDEAKGSLKTLHRLIVTSATYRQASAQREDAAKLDADNRLLWRQNRQRLDADAFRDFTLAASGRLDLTMGGPAVQHFKQSKGPQSTPALDYTAHDWAAPGATRRSIHRFVWRGIADPFMEALDFPDLGLLAPARSFSVSSLQALTLYNNAFVLHHSAALARRAEVETTTLEGQVANAVRLVWLRAPTADESRDFTGFARAHGLPALCRVLLNSNEFLFVP